MKRHIIQLSIVWLGIYGVQLSAVSCPGPIPSSHGIRQILVDDIFPNLCQTSSLLDTLSFCNSIPLTQADITSSPILAIPGQHYCFEENIIGDITISAADIILNLNNCTLTGSITVTSADYVVIKNGRITTVSLVDSALIDVVDADFITIEQCNVSAPLALTGGPVALLAVSIDSDSQNACIIDCTLAGGGSVDFGGGQGIILDGPNAQIDNCTVSGFTAVSISASAVNTHVTDSTMTSVQATTVDSQNPGVRVAASDVIINDCLLAGSDSSFDAGDTGTSGSGGDALVITAAKVLVSNCQLSGGIGADNSGTGNAGNGGRGILVDAGGNEAIIRNCRTTSTGSGGNALGAGTSGNGGDGIFLESSVTNVQVSGCWITNIGDAGFGGLLNGYAIQDQTVAVVSPPESIIYNNVAYNVTGNAGTVYIIHNVPAGTTAGASTNPLFDNIYY